jgi:hypothetical protein
MDALNVVHQYLLTFDNLQVAGRNGMHKYNNQDHSMVTAILASRNLLGAQHDVWAVNADEDYHEEGHLQADDFEVSLQDLARTQPRVPTASAGLRAADNRAPDNLRRSGALAPERTEP